jgi:hypothetical protein
VHITRLLHIAKDPKAPDDSYRFRHLSTFHNPYHYYWVEYQENKKQRKGL